MNNQTPSGPLDEASLPDGDLEFVGVEERTVFAPAGYVNRAVNTRFRYRRAATRAGITILPWGKGNGLTPFNEVYGAFVYADPNGINEYFLIAADGGVFYTRPNQPSRPVPLPGGVTLSRATFKRFVQANASVILLRGLSADGTQLKPLKLGMNADGAPDFQGGFQLVVQENVWPATLQAATNRVLLPQHNLLQGDPVRLAPAAGVNLPAPLVADKTYFVRDIPNGNEFTLAATPGGNAVTWNVSNTDSATYAVTVTLLDGAYPIPEANDGIFAQNRLLLIDGKDTVAVSDIGDFTRYVPTQSEFRINQGDAYTLKYLYLFNESTLLLFKNGNVSKVLGVTGDLSGAVGPLNVTQAYGMAAPSVADIGTDVYWLNSELRVTSLNLTELNKEQGTNQALSDPLLQTFGRINPGFADRARLAVFDGFLHVALPLDDATVLGSNVVPAGTTYNQQLGSAVGANVALTPGQTYQFLAGANEQALLVSDALNNTTTYYGDTLFTVPAGSAGVVLLVAPLGTAAGATVTAQLIPVVAQGCNTGVAVYDFLNQAWCGTDESAVTCVVDWLKFTYNGKQQLAFIGADGYLHLYADGYEDERVAAVATPYLDFFCDPLSPWSLQNFPNDTVQINGGTMVAQSPATALNVANTWGLKLAAPGANLWQDANGTGGYNPAAGSHWTAPGCTVSQIADGIRLVPANGTQPTVLINGVAPTGGKVVGNSGTLTYYFDWHSGNEIHPVDIVSRVLTRAYPCKSFQNYAKAITTGLRTDFKRYTCVQLHLAGWDPSYSISTLTQGQGDEQPYLQNETRNYLKYFTPMDAADWNPANTGDDFHGPNREDYAYPERGAGILLGSGVNFDQVQEYTDTVPLSERGIYVQIDLQNTSGHLELAGLELEAQDGEQNSGPSVKN